MKIIKLASGEKVFVDDVDFDKVKAHTWFKEQQSHTIYARTVINGKYVKMHRFILGLTDMFTVVDHRDGNGLNNQRENIRKCSRSDNMKNRKAWGTSLFLGVSKHRNKWVAKINSNGIQKHIGVFDTEQEAAKAYNDAALKYGNGFHKLNVI